MCSHNIKFIFNKVEQITLRRHSLSSSDINKSKGCCFVPVSVHLVLIIRILLEGLKDGLTGKKLYVVKTNTSPIASTK